MLPERLRARFVDRTNFGRSRLQSLFFRQQFYCFLQDHKSNRGIMLFVIIYWSPRAIVFCLIVCLFPHRRRNVIFRKDGRPESFSGAFRHVG